MSNKNPILLLVALCLLPFGIILSQPTNTTFSFTLPSTAITSAGVYNADSALVRTLWSGVRYISGIYTEKWDGLLDNRTPAPTNGNYHVKVLSHNVQYNWDGARIGNTSDALTGSTAFKGYLPISSLAIAGDKLYYCNAYQEGANTQYVVNLNNIHARTRIDPQVGAVNHNTYVNCTDGNYVYWGGYTFNSGNFVFATRVSDNQKVIFPNGAAAHGSSTIYSAAVLSSTPDPSDITSIAVQKAGNYLFVVRRPLSKLQVVNKITGALVREITINNIGYIATDTVGNLWVSHGAIVEKYTVNSDGTISTAGVTLSGITEPAAIAVSPDNNTVVVADVGITQQVVKGFSNSTGGSSIWILGTPGGYMSDATVTNYKFYFRDIRAVSRCSIAFQPDGSFWVNDEWNNRIQHYSANRVFVDRIMYLGRFYETHVDPNNKNRLFSSIGNHFIEFALDYTKPLDNGQNGSWVLAKNWGATVNSNYELEKGVRNVTTFGGRTFTIISTFSHTYDLFELVQGGQMRKTKYSFSGNVSIDKAGRKIDNINGYQTGSASQYNVYAFTGFDIDNDPIWASTPNQIITSPILTSTDAASPVGGSQLANNKIYYFQGNAVQGNPGLDYHLAAFDINTSQWKFRTSLGTSSFYTGNFPSKGEFDNANGVSQAGAYTDVDGNNIIWTYRGEFWKSGQTNYFNHFHTSGLHIGLFGAERTENNTGREDFVGGEGNMFSGSWVQDTPDKAFFFSGGEGVNAGVHRWRIEGLNSIQLQTCSFNPSLNYTPSPPNLMTGLIHGQEITSGLGWTISHPSTPLIYFQTSWNVIAGRKTASKYGPQDVSVYYFQDGSSSNQIRTITRNLGTNTGLNIWKVSGKISFDGSHISNTGGRGGACYLEVLDQAGKIITSFNEEEVSRHSGASFVRGNNVDLNRYADPGQRQADAIKSQPFQISNNNGTLTFQYATYAAITIQVAEAGADVTRPTTIRLRFTPGDYEKAMSVAELQFLKDTTNHYRTKGSGDWGNLNTWESSSDSVTWNDATEIPNSVANSINIRTGHTVAITGAAAVDQMTIQNGAAINVAPKASLWINDGAGDDIKLVGSGKLTIQSDSSGSGRIGNSTGNINGSVIVEKYIPSGNKKAYHLLSPSVNTAGVSKPYIRDNWQEGQNNTSILANSNIIPGYGTHITGSLLGTNGFDATALATPSLLLFNQSAGTQGFAGVPNTNATSLEAKKGYLLFVRGDRSIDLATGLRSANTTLRATGAVLIGTQTYTGQEGNGRLSLVGNPYASPINWNTIATDASTANSANFENYCTYWDPNIGESGGYVNISVNGTKSTADNKATEILAGQAFFVKAKPGVSAPTFTIKESHKSAIGNMNAFRTDAQAQFATSLYYTTLLSRRVQTDAVNAVFDSNLSAGVDGDDAEEIPNDNENIALTRGGKMLGIEARPLIGNTDTLLLRTQRLKVQVYEWQFQPMAFDRPSLKAYLEDRFLNTRTEINFTDSAITVIPFLVTVVPGSAATDRFRIIFTTNASLPIALQSLQAYQKGTGIEVNWVTGTEDHTERYEVEKSADARQFTAIGTILPQASVSPANTYHLFDPHPKEGNNYYRIKTVEKNGTITYSTIVNVKMGSKKTGFDIYPNPVTGNTITIQLNNVSRGAYNANLVNAVGQKVFSKTLNHLGGSASQSIIMADNLPLGTYYLQVTGNGISYNKKIIK